MLLAGKYSKSGSTTEHIFCARRNYCFLQENTFYNALQFKRSFALHI